MATPPVFVSGAVLTSAQMNDVGMWKVHSAAYTTVSSVTISNIFTSDFRNYKMILSPTAMSGNGFITMQFTIATVATTTNYITRCLTYHSTGSGLELEDNPSGTDEVSISKAGATSVANVFIETLIGSPALATNTKVSSHGPGNFGGNVMYLQVIQGFHTAATAFDGLKLIFPGGNSSGTITIYGLRN